MLPGAEVRSGAHRQKVWQTRRLILSLLGILAGHQILSLLLSYLLSSLVWNCHRVLQQTLTLRWLDRVLAADSTPCTRTDTATHPAETRLSFESRSFTSTSQRCATFHFLSLQLFAAFASIGYQRAFIHKASRPFFSALRQGLLDLDLSALYLDGFSAQRQRAAKCDSTKPVLIFLHRGRFVRILLRSTY